MKIDRSKLRTVAPTTTAYEAVEFSAADAGARRRETEGGLLWRSGRLPLNTNASDVWDEVLRNTPDLPNDWVALYYANESAQTVKVVPSRPGVAGGSAVRSTPRGGDTQVCDYTLNLNGVFAKYPSLRPTGRVKVTAGYRVDPNGLPFMEISLQTAVAAPKTSRKAGAKKTAEKDAASADDTTEEDQ